MFFLCVLYYHSVLLFVYFVAQCSDEEDSEFKCVPGRFIVPTVMSIYLIVANILLINLLIAVFKWVLRMFVSICFIRDSLYLTPATKIQTNMHAHTRIHISGKRIPGSLGNFKDTMTLSIWCLYLPILILFVFDVSYYHIDSIFYILYYLAALLAKNITVKVSEMYFNYSSNIQIYVLIWELSDSLNITNFFVICHYVLWYQTWITDMFFWYLNYNNIVSIFNPEYVCCRFTNSFCC